MLGNVFSLADAAKDSDLTARSGSSNKVRTGLMSCEDHWW